MAGLVNVTVDGKNRLVPFCLGCGGARRWFDDFEADVPEECPQCGGKILEDPPPSAPVPESVPEKAGVAENVRERVEKIRHVSSIMIDQAAYDPSLRFILVAAVLFVLFLVLLILSKVIG